MNDDKKTPLLSVIVPIYNVQNYLQRCVDSLVAQTIKDFEIILVDDGSTDESASICDENAKKNKNIRVIHKKNGGLSSARNAGLEIATGKYISFIDSDDYVEPDMMKVLIDRAEKDNSELVECDVTKHVKSEIKENCLNIVDGTLQINNKNLSEFNKLFGIKISVLSWDKLYRRDIIERYKIRFVDTKKILSEDQLFLVCYCRFVKKISFTNRSLYHYDIKDVSLSRGVTKINIINQWIDFVSEAKKFMDVNDPDCADQTTYNVMIWERFCNACWHLKSKDNFYKSMESVSTDNKKLLKKSFFSVAFGKAGKVVIRNKKLNFKGQLILRFTAFLLFLGIYDFPLQIYLQP